MVEEEKEIAVDEIEQPDIFMLREVKGMDVDSLAADIEREGLISAVTVRLSATMTGPPRHQLIVGHRRLAAIKKLKRKVIRARVVEKTDEQGLVMAMAENLERKDMTPIEEARAIEKARLIGMKEKELAKLLGKSIAWISQRGAILKMTPEVQTAVEKGVITPGHVEKGFAKLKHPQDQKALLDDLKEQHNMGEDAGVDYAERQAKDLAETRKSVEELATYLQQNKDRIKFPRCPKCGSDPVPSKYQMDLKKDQLYCPKCYGTWNAIRGIPKARETTLGGELSGRETAPRGETVVKVEACGHRSAIEVQRFFNKIAELITQGDAVLSLKTEEDFGMMGGGGHLDLVVSINKRKIPDIPIMELEPKVYKKTPHVTKAEIYHSWGGGNNKEVIKNRELFWALEKKIDPKVQPAEISREALLRVVVDHKALSKGVELPGPKGTWKVHSIHRDYTAWMVAPNGAVVLVEEPALRIMAKAAKKAEKQGKGARGKVDLLAEPPKTIKTVKPKAAPAISPAKPEPGVCSSCGCTEGEACEDVDGEPCGWANEEQTLCTRCAKIFKMKKKRK